jgi:hypothetical protein
VTATITTNLRTKAETIEEAIESFMIEPHGALYSMLNTTTRKPFVEGDLTPEDDYLGAYNKGNSDFKPWEGMNYEDCGMVTAAYLAAQTFKWHVTGEASARERVERCLQGIIWNYELGAEQEKGFFPKTYGGKTSPEISSDQYLYVIKALRVYLPIASEEQAAKIREMIANMVDFWVNRDYRYPYFAIPDMQWPLGRFPSLLYAAHAVTGDEKYLAEAKRINQEYEVYRYPIESQIMVRHAQGLPLNDMDVRMGNRLVGQYITECTAMDIMELDESLLLSDEHRAEWLNSLQMSWREGILALVEGDSGLVKSWVLYDPQTGEVGSPEPQWTGNTNPMGWSLWDWMGKYVTPCGSMLAHVGVHVAHWLPEENAAEIVRTILHEADVDDMWHRYIDPDGQQLRPEHRFLHNQVEVHAFVNWLWAYWQGRHEGLLTD